MKRQKKLLLNEANQKERFSIRKLTIGAASVLLGTTLFWGANTAYADVEKNPSEPTEAVETSQPKTDSQQDETSKNKQNTNTVQSTSDSVIKKAENNAPVQASKSTASQVKTDESKADKSKTDDDKQTLEIHHDQKTPATANLQDEKAAVRSNSQQEKPYFTGAVYIKNTDGSDVPAFNTANGIEIHSGDQYLLKYQLQAQGGDSNTTNTKFILLVPTGFTTNGLENDGSANSNPYTIESLGKTKNGELIYQVTTNKTPNTANGQVDLKAIITASNSDDPAIYGKHTYNLWNQLVFGEADSVISNPQFGPGYGGGNTDIELENGTKITASKNILGVEGQQNGQINYTLMPANAREVNIGNSGIDINYSVTANSHPVQGKLGQEDLNVTLNFPNHNISDNQKIKDGDYIDFKLGIPYKDEQGNTKVLPYDTILANPDGFPNDGQLKTQSGTTIGQIYNMGTYYRVIFNSNTGNFYSNNVDEASLTISFSLPWQNADFSSQSIASVCWPYTYYLYQYTNDKSKDGTGFMKQLSDDVNINGKTYASGLNIRGKYIYRGYFAQKNTQNVESISPDTVRNWNSQTNAVNVNTEWQNINNIKLALKGANNDQNVGYDFKIVTQVGKSPLINYQWKTDSEVAQEIKNIISTPKKTNLKNQVLNTSDFISYDQTNGTKPTSEVTVTHVDQNTSDKLKRIYHIVISNPDVVLNGSISTLTASASGFTLPDNIKNYGDETAHLVSQGNYSGDDTANQELLNALINTERVNSIVIDQSGKDISLNNQGTKWTAWAYETPTGSSVNGFFSVKDLEIAKLKFIDEETNQQVGSILTTQGGGGYKITFPTFETVLQELKNQGYDLDYIENQAGNGVSQDQLGKFIPSNLKFTAYLKKNTETSSYKVHYIDISGKRLPEGQSTWQPADGTDLTSHDVTVSGYVGATSSAQLWNYAADGYTLVQAPENLGTQVFEKTTPDQYVFIKNDNVTPPVTENGSYKIYYIDLGANSTKTTNLVPGDGILLNAHTISVTGKVGETPSPDLWDYSNDHYALVSSPNNLGNVKIFKNMPDQYVYLKHQIQDISDQKTITETIKYQYEDGTQAANDSTKSFTFTGNGYNDLVTNEDHYNNWDPASHSFNQVEIPNVDHGSDKYKVVSATLNDNQHTSYLSSDKKYVMAIAVNHKSADPVITVIFKKVTSGTNDHHTPPADDHKPPKQHPSTSEPEPDHTNPTPPQTSTPSSIHEQNPIPEDQVPQTPIKNKTHQKESAKVKKQNKQWSTNSPIHAQDQTQKAGENATPLSTKHLINGEKKTISNKRATLPETGEKDSQLGIFGIGIIALAALFGIADIHKRKD